MGRRADRALSAAGLGVWDWDVVTGELAWDPRIAELHGFDPPETFDGTLDAFFTRVHPEDLPNVQAAIQLAITRGGAFATEFRVVRPDGTTAWIQGRGEAVMDSANRPVRMIGIGMDTTELRSPRVRVARTLDHLRDGLVMLDPTWTVVYANPAALDLVGLSRDELVGRNHWEVFAEAVGSEFWDRYHEAIRTQLSGTFEAFYGPLDGWFEVRTLPGPDGLTVQFRNINDRRAAEAERSELVASLERALEREQRSNALSVVLTQTRTVSEVASALLEYSRRELETLFGGIALLDDAGTSLEFVTLESLPDETVEQWMVVPLTERSALTDCVRSGEPSFHGSRRELLAEYPDLRDAVEVAGNHAFANVPLIIESRVLGALSMSWSGEREFSDDDRSFIVTIAAVCAQAIDRCMLSERQQRVVETLQRAILPDSLPDVIGAELCARYLPATKGFLVGGDWYDAFTLRDGRLALTVGDVSGHGLTAAAVMGQLRNAIRAYAFDGDDPGVVLTKLDALVSAGGDGLLATAVVAVFDPATGELRWASAGHPPPLLGHRIGWEFLADPFGPLLGTETHPAYVTNVCAMGEDCVVLLYTDGLIEHRTVGVDAGLDALRREALSADATPLGAFCDAIITATRRALTQEDDLCVLALRRPPGVGANP